MCASSNSLHSRRVQEEKECNELCGGRKKAIQKVYSYTLAMCHYDWKNERKFSLGFPLIFSHAAARTIVDVYKMNFKVV